MESEISNEVLFTDFYKNWIDVYKTGSVRQVTLNKYLMTLTWIRELVPDLKIQDLSRIQYQLLINKYAENHERQTTMDFHHQLKGAILDALDEGLISRDPTRKVIIKGNSPVKRSKNS